MDYTRGSHTNDTTNAYGEDTHTGVGHEYDEGEHDEKKSVLKKVKAKAKKIKNTITGHHDHDHGHGHDRDDDEDDDDDDDDEMDTGPNIHAIPGGADPSDRVAIGGHNAPACNPGAYQVFDPTTTHYVPGQDETLGWSRTDTGTRLGPAAWTGELGVSDKPKIGGVIEKDAHIMKHGVDLSTGVPIGREGMPVESQTFDTSNARYVPGQEETLGWSRADTGTRKLSEEQPYAPRNTPVVAHPGHHHARQPGMLGEVLDERTNLEKDPHAPLDVGQKRHPENYQSKVIDPSGRGGEEIGVTPVVHQLGRMNIDDSHSDVKIGQQEQKPESYTEKISSVASEIAHKAKQATGSITSKLGYGKSETPTPTTNPSTNVPDKGVSMKEYLAEKLKPSEEDKALSKAITESVPLHKPKISQGDVVGGEKVVVVKGRVTESEEVANRLGRSEETSYDGVGPGLASPGKSVMDRIMDATGSWFNMGSVAPQAEPNDHPQGGDGRTHRSNVEESQHKQNIGGAWGPGVQ